MDDSMLHVEQLIEACRDADAAAGTGTLVQAVNARMPGLDFQCVLTRGSWYRLGGVVDGEYRRISDNILHWAEQESAGDVDELVTRFVDRGWFATRLAGVTHFLTSQRGDKPEDFIQLEIEELCEVLDRPLVERDWLPDSIEEFLDPLDYPRLEPEPVGRPYYQFRRLTPIAQLLDEQPGTKQNGQALRRFFADWRLSSASEETPFCRHWVLALREYMDSDGECRLSAKPLNTFAGALPDLPPGDSLQGSQLANAIHGYDRRLGYPFAWYFMMLSSKAANYTLADAVLRDLMGAYAYLPPRDLKVLRQWEERPYGV